MAPNTPQKLCFLLFICWIPLTSASAQLFEDNYYAGKCPKALETVRSHVKAAVAKEARMGESLLRLHFHVCFVNECDASILLDDTANFIGEKTARPNANSVKRFNSIDTVKLEVEKLCPGIVSCADILAIVARDSVVALGGPSWQVQLGRRDSTTVNRTAANTNLPSPKLNLSDLITTFTNKGFTTQERVALLGSYTIGEARCMTFQDWLYNESNMNSSFATPSNANCPSSRGDNNLSPLDVTSPSSFNNGYFRNLVSQKGLLHSDQQLFNGGLTNAQVTTYSKNFGSFQKEFAKVVVKMGGFSPLTSYPSLIFKK